jgi:DNA invertase Pin-like site-specific DNA recombinase
MKKDYEKHTYVYVRTSTVKQLQDSQINAIENYVKEKNIKIDQWFKDVGSGKKTNRAELMKMIEKLRRGDTVIVWRFDRLSRSSQQLITIANEFKDKGVKFISINNNLDTSTKEGMLFYTIMSGFAEYEAELIRERVEEGLLAARKNPDKIFGRPRKNEKQVQEAVDLYHLDKYTFEEIKERTGVSKTTIYRRLREIKARDFNTKFEAIVDIVDDEMMLKKKLESLKKEIEIDFNPPSVDADEDSPEVQSFMKSNYATWIVYNKVVGTIEGWYEDDKYFQKVF